MGFIHVAAAVIVNDCDEVLLALRPKDKHQGGLWEFPGGKVEAGEDALVALDRELKEELDINVAQARPLIRVHHHYSDKSVLLDVWRVDGFEGEPHGREGQAVEWVPAEKLHERQFPAANLPIVNAAQLPDRYLITPEPEDSEQFLAQLEQSLDNGVRLVQLRAKSLSEESYKALATEVLEVCHRYGAKLLLNAPPQWVTDVGADGVHLSSSRLMELTDRSLPESFLVAASCHNEEELAQAQEIGADFAVLGSVAVTASHPGINPLGWEKTQALLDEVALPVFALGGMTLADIDTAFQHGAQGIAAIRALWGEQVAS